MSKNFKRTYTLGEIMSEYEHTRKENKETVLDFISKLSGVSVKELLDELHNNTYKVGCRVSGNVYYLVRDEDKKLTKDEIEEIIFRKWTKDKFGPLTDLSMSIADVHRIKGAYSSECRVSGLVEYEVTSLTADDAEEDATYMYYNDDFGSLDHIEMQIEYVGAE